MGWVQYATVAETGELAAADDIAQHVGAARVAASRFDFVYPPLEHPDAPTAYAEVVALEAMGSQRAAQRDFVEGELSTAKSLVALAHDDPVARSEKLREVREDPSQSTILVARLESLEREEALESAPPKRERVAAVSGAARRPSRAAPGASDDDADPSLRHKSARRGLRRQLRQALRARRAGKLQVAKTHYHRAIDAAPGNIEALDGLARVTYDQAEYGQSVKYARIAVKHVPNSGPRWIFLGDALYKVMRYSDALDAYAEARKRGVALATARIDKVRKRLGR